MDTVTTALTMSAPDPGPHPDLLTATVPSSSCPPPIEPDWDEAFVRVESYLRAHQIESRIQLNRLTSEIIQASRARAKLEPDADPVTLAIHVAEARLEAWCANVLGSRERAGLRGRLALAMANVPGRWPQHFLADTPPPPELVAAMRASYIETGPELKLTAMVPRKIDFGPVANAAGETWKTFRRLPFLRAVTGWVLIVALLAVIWVITHP
ncbi:hypothetical protein OpiT1DRAFT_05703 [Opitutaceae bacterium TAV1]|nr:hypothetical protein OpiT1DRAFT_05703 [Opitutaceae bacterium TAV1]